MNNSRSSSIRTQKTSDKKLETPPPEPIKSALAAYLGETFDKGWLGSARAVTTVMQYPYQFDSPEQQVSSP